MVGPPPPGTSTSVRRRSGHHPPPRGASHQEPTIDDDIELISDGDGLAVIGDPTAVDRFLASEGLPSENLGLPRLGEILGAGAAVAQAGSVLAANSSRWVKLTKESAHLVTKYGLRQSSTTGLSTGVAKGNKGQIGAFVEFAAGPGTRLTDPALLAGAAGIMTQMAMQQAMNEVTDYLATIDKKVDDVLRAQKDVALARMIGTGLIIEEAMTIREYGGRVNEVTWSKVQAAPATIAESQAYALRQLDALAEQLERTSTIGDLAAAVEEAASRTQEWLAVLARCFQLQDAIAVLELDRARHAVPEDLDQHRLGLKTARQSRLELITRSTERLMAHIEAAAGTANAKVLLHPAASPAVVRSSNHVAVAVLDFHDTLGIERSQEPLDARRWVEAATESKDKLVAAGEEGLNTAQRLGKQGYEQARSMAGKLGHFRRGHPADDGAGPAPSGAACTTTTSSLGQNGP